MSSPSQYAQIADFFVYGIPATARGPLTDAQINGALTSASSTMDSHFRGRYPLPFTAWGQEVTKYCCWIAAYELLSGTKGYNPAAGADPNILLRYQQALEWLNGVQRQAIHPDVTVSPTVDQSSYAQPTVISSSFAGLGSGATTPNRGW